MKKAIAAILIGFMMLTLFSGCKNNGNTNGTDDTTKQNYSEDDKSESRQDAEDTQNTDNDGDVYVWELKDIDFQEYFSPLKTKSVYPFENVEVKLVESPFTYTAEEMLEKIKGMDYFDGYSFSTKIDELATQKYYTDIGSQYAITAGQSINGYKNGETSASFSLLIQQNLPKSDGVSHINLTVDNISISNKTIQKELEPIFNEIFGEKIGFAMLYAKDQSFSSKGMDKTVSSDESEHEYKIKRTLSSNDAAKESGKFTAQFDIQILSGTYNKYEEYRGDYVSIAKDLKYDIADIFEKRLGDTANFDNAETSLSEYMKIDDEPYEKTILDGYTIEISEDKDGTKEYHVITKWYKGNEDHYGWLSITASEGIEVQYIIKEDKNGNMIDYSFEITGSPTDISMAWNSDDQQKEKNEKYETLLKFIKEELKLVFGDGIDLSNVKLDNFEKYDDYDGGEANLRDCDIPAKFNFFGNECDVNVHIKLSDSMVDTWRGTWFFSVK